MQLKPLLLGQLVLMMALIVLAIMFPVAFRSALDQPDLYRHAKFIHILSVTLFFANTVIGTLWETRALLSKRADIIRYTYQTVSWLDSVFTAPLILISVLSGIMLATIVGGVWSMGWLSTAFLLFFLSGLVWVTLDIPTQYQINRLFQSLPPDSPSLPRPLKRLLWTRVGINFMGSVPLAAIFILMTHKPEVPNIADWFRNEPRLSHSENLKVNL